MKLSSENPLVSVIILCYNQADIVSRAIESVLNQTYKNIQVVLVDDCSRDNSRQVITDWQMKYPERIKTFFQPTNVGHPANMNTGYRLCDGELITFCDGDDWYFPEKVEREVELLKRNPDIDVVYSNFDFYTVEGQFLRNWVKDGEALPTGDIFPALLALEYPEKAHFHYEMTSKKILEGENYYDERIPIWVDWDLRLRLAAKYKFGYCPNVSSAYAQNPQGLTNVLKQETILNYYRFVVEKNRRHLDAYPKSVSKKVNREINLSLNKLELAIKLHKGEFTFFNSISFFCKYPSELKDRRFLMNTLFGKKLVEGLARALKRN
jgi:glycosyltransferase involved in cell wall biosynthesis